MKKFGNYGYPKVRSNEPLQWLRERDLKNLYSPGDDMEVSTRKELERDRILNEDERIEENYNFNHTQADLLKLSGSLGASISFLGTACAIPSKYRNVSGILLHLPTPTSNHFQDAAIGSSNNNSSSTSKNSSSNNNSSSSSSSSSGYYNIGQSTMLLDAGEGTWQQMVRMAYHTPSLVAPNPSDPRTRTSAHEPVITSNSDPEPDIPDNSQDHGLIHRNDGIIDSVETVLARDLKVVWISHPHADHHLGLLMILSERKRLLTARSKRMKENAKKVINRPVGERVSVVGKTQKSKKIEKDSKEDESKCKNEYGESEEFHPLLLIAPPSILSFLRDFCELDTGGLVHGSYIPVSSRQFDKRDNCKNGDSYWQDIVKENLNAVFGDEDLEVKSEFSDGKNSTSDASTESNYSTRPAFQQNWQIVAKENLLLGKKILSEVGIVDLENVKVIHCPQAFGLVMQLSTTTDDLKKTPTAPSDMLLSTPIQCSSPADSDLDSIVSEIDPQPARKLKIVYSGDTRPSSLLTAIGRDATILIHEATFEDDEAGAFRHKYPVMWCDVM